MKLRVFTNNADKSVARDKPPKIDAAESASSETESKRLDGRRARSQRTHALIIDTYLTLLRETQRIPTADRIAARAGLSQRGIFGHFPDLKALGIAAFDHIMSMGLSTPVGDKPQAGRQERIRFQVEVRARNCEAWLPLWRIVLRAYQAVPEVRQRIEMLRALTRTRIELMYEPELGTLPAEQRIAIVAALEGIVDFENWGRLREHYKLSYEAACEAWVHAIDRLLPPSPAHRR